MNGTGDDDSTDPQVLMPAPLWRGLLEGLKAASLKWPADMSASEDALRAVTDFLLAIPAVRDSGVVLPLQGLLAALPDLLPFADRFNQLNEQVVSFIEGMTKAKAAWDAAPRDDHSAERWRQWEAVGVQLELAFELTDLFDKLLGNFLDHEEAMHLAALDRPLRALRDQLLELRSRKVGPLLKPIGPKPKEETAWVALAERFKRRQSAVVATMVEALLPADYASKSDAWNVAARAAARILDRRHRSLPAHRDTEDWKVVRRAHRDFQTFAYANPDAPATQLYRGLLARMEEIRTVALENAASRGVPADLSKAMEDFARTISRDIA